MTWKRAMVPVPDPELLYKAHVGLMDQVPCTINILREVKYAEGTHLSDWTPEPVGGITTSARVSLTGSASSNVSDILTGHQERDVSWGLMLPPNVPLHTGDGEDGRSRLEFLHPVHGRLRIRRLRPWVVDQSVVGWNGDLERITGSTPSPPIVTPSGPKGAGRPRLEDDAEHPWRQLVAKAEQLRARSPGLTWDQAAARVGITRERLDTYRRRARSA